MVTTLEESSLDPLLKIERLKSLRIEKRGGGGLGDSALGKLRRLPLADVDGAIGWPMPWLDAYLTHPEPNGFWTRLDICGAVFPLYDRNPNTGRGPFDAATAIAIEQVHHGPQTLSRLILPVVAATTGNASAAGAPSKYDRGSSVSRPVSQKV